MQINIGSTTPVTLGPFVSTSGTLVSGAAVTLQVLAVLLIVTGSYAQAQAQTLVWSGTAVGATAQTSSGSAQVSLNASSGSPTLIVATVIGDNGYSGSAPPTFSDSLSNLWYSLPLVGSPSATTPSLGMWYALSPSLSSSQTFKVNCYSSTHGGPILIVTAFNGGPWQLFTASGFCSSASTTSVAAGSITPSGSTSVWVAAMSGETGTAPTFTGPFSSLLSLAGSTNVNYSAGVATYAQTASATAQNPLWYISSAVAALPAELACFVPAASGGGGATVAFLGSPSGTVSSGTLNISSGSTGYTSGGTLNVPAAQYVYSGSLTNFTNGSGSLGTLTLPSGSGHWSGDSSLTGGSFGVGGNGTRATLAITPTTAIALSQLGSGTLNAYYGNLTAANVLSGGTATLGNVTLTGTASAGAAVTIGGLAYSGSALTLAGGTAQLNGSSGTLFSGAAPATGGVTSNQAAFQIGSGSGTLSFSPSANGFWIGSLGLSGTNATNVVSGAPVGPMTSGSSSTTYKGSFLPRH